MKAKETMRGPGGLLVKLDAGEIYPADPGNGTPVMVHLPFGHGSATYWCACGEGDIEGMALTQQQFDWLQSLDNAITQWLNTITRTMESTGRKETLAALAADGGSRND